VNPPRERWFVWGAGALLTAWSCGYACATGQFGLLPFIGALLIVTCSVTVGLVRIEISDAVTRALHPWRRGSQRRKASR
jgi:hypothetical protein